jgi:hypothetical protein
MNRMHIHSLKSEVLYEFKFNSFKLPELTTRIAIEVFDEMGKIVTSIGYKELEVIRTPNMIKDTITDELMKGLL